LRYLVLLDIDGTILTTNGAAAAAFRSALEQVFGTSGPTDGYSFAGKTDPQIARDLLRIAGLPDSEIDHGLPEVWPRYVEELAPRLTRQAVRLLPGARELIEHAHAEPNWVLGLLTGNVREGARLKLEAAGIDFALFRIGAFGSDHAERGELPALAARAAEEQLSRRFHGKSIVVIGDTPHDISCGEKLGVRTIAVASGSYSVDDLEACGPDHVFATLEDTVAVRKAVEGLNG
jgi:phosphoglycolate phosphatase-like HAD superfamily hydrolase